MKPWYAIGLLSLPLLLSAEDTFMAPPLQEAPSWDDPLAIQAGDWSLSIGVAAEWEAAYLGSDDAEVDFAPQIQAQYWLHPRFGLGLIGATAGVIVRPTGTIMLQAGLGLMGGRDESDSNDLRGMGDISDGIGLVVASRFTLPYESEISIVASQDLKSDQNGLTVEFEASKEFELTSKIEWALGLSALWADETHNQNFYGVTATQAARSGYNTYDVGQGFQAAGVEIEFEYEPSPRWEFELSLGYQVLLGDLKDSPLVQEDYAIEIETGVSYSF